MWSKREVEGKDCEIERISAKDLSIELFQKHYVDQNIPVIITDLNLWNEKAQNTDIAALDKYLADDLLLQNVFVSSNKHNRFLYFDDDDDDDEKKRNEKSQIRTKMAWNEFKQRITQSSNSDYKHYLNAQEHYYLYGEPLPKSLLKHVHFPSFLPLDKTANDNCLIWISSHRTCSPLHFDFCQGFLCQLNGIKRVCLFPLDVDKFESFYPFDNHSKHKRQSMINDIHKPDADKFGLFAKDKEISGYQGLMKHNEGLYIPIGWWHQIEADDECGSISLSFRWNPYFEDVKNAILTSSKVENGLISDIIFTECIAKTPFYIKNIAHVWRNIFDAKRNNKEDHTDGKSTAKEKTVSDIDLLGVD